MTCGFLITSILQPLTPFLSGAPPPKKNPGSAPVPRKVLLRNVQRPLKFVSQTGSVTKNFYVSPCEALCLQIIYDQFAAKRSIRPVSSRGWFAFPRGGFAVVTFAWNYFVQIRLALTRRFTKLVETKNTHYLLKEAVTITRMTDTKVFNQWKSWLGTTPPPLLEIIFLRLKTT